MIEQICKNCKFWQEDDYENTKSVKNCTRVEMIWEVSEWREVDEDCQRVIKEEYKDYKAFVKDGSDYMAKLLTKADFGCNQFENI